MKFIDPPQGTSIGYREADGRMWIPCERDGKPGIAVCVFPGNLLNAPGYRPVASFETFADRDFVLQLHAMEVVQ